MQKYFKDDTKVENLSGPWDHFYHLLRPERRDRPWKLEIFYTFDTSAGPPVGCTRRLEF